MLTKSRSIEVNKTGSFLYTLSVPSINYKRIKRSYDINISMSLVICELHVVLTSPVTFDLWGVLDLLSPSLSITWLRVPDPPTFQHETLKNWEWACRRGYHDPVYAWASIMITVQSLITDSLKGRQRYLFTADKFYALDCSSYRNSTLILEPLRSRHLSTPDNRQPAWPQSPAPNVSTVHKCIVLQ